MIVNLLKIVLLVLFLIAAIPVVVIALGGH
jgi:hypothetical protein